MRSFIVMLAIMIIAASLVAHDYVPGAPQTQPILLKGGDLYTVSDGILPNTDLIFEKGRIVRIGEGLQPPSGAKTIDLTGMRIYPGLIAPLSVIGLTEIGEVHATNDTREVGRVHPEVMGHVAYNTDSEIIPSVRANGVTTALVVPRGGVISGRSSLMNLDGWNYEDAAEKLNVALHVNWPSERLLPPWETEKTPEEQKKEKVVDRKRLADAFDDAKAYSLAKRANPNIERDARWEAMLPIFTREMPLFITANDCRQIEQAVAFAKKNGFRIVIAGGREAYRAIDLLRDANIPVILERTHTLPMRADDDYDISYRSPKLLHDGGVKFCFSTGFGATGTRNLPLQAGQAVAFGLSKAEALRGITLTTAEILGVQADLGSLEVGKKATLIVSEGDILDALTARVVLEFIEGREVDLSNRHTEMYEKYRSRPDD